MSMRLIYIKNEESHGWRLDSDQIADHPHLERHIGKDIPSVSNLSLRLHAWGQTNEESELDVLVVVDQSGEIKKEMIL
jgi:hypothetical protein